MCKKCCFFQYVKHKNDLCTKISLFWFVPFKAKTCSLNGVIKLRHMTV